MNSASAMTPYTLPSANSISPHRVASAVTARDLPNTYARAGRSTALRICQTISVAIVAVGGREWSGTGVGETDPRHFAAASRALRASMNDITHR